MKLFGSFPPAVSLYFRTLRSSSEVSFVYAGTEIGHLIFSNKIKLDNGDNRLWISDIKKTTYAATSGFFNDDHIGTELLNETLCFMYFQFDFIPKYIAGWLSFADRDNKNWYTSIPFYAHFKNYLSEKLPYKITRFRLFTDQDFQNPVLLPELITREFIKELCDKYNNLYFLMTTHMN